MTTHPSKTPPQLRKLYRLQHAVVTIDVPVTAGIVNVPAAAAVLETATVPVIAVLTVAVVLEIETAPVITDLTVSPAVVLETVIQVQAPIIVLVITRIAAAQNVVVVAVVVVVAATTLTTDTVFITHMFYPTTFVLYPVQSRPFLPKCHPCTIL